MAKQPRLFYLPKQIQEEGRFYLGENNMETPNLLFICISAFIAVFLILTVLAIMMRIIIMIFPQKIFKADAAVIAAVTTTVTSVFPGTKITKIEEIK